MDNPVRKRSIRTTPQSQKPKRNRRVSWHEDVVDNSIICSSSTSSSTPSSTSASRELSDDLYLSWPFVLLYLVLLALMAAAALHFYWRLPEPVTNGDPNQFHAPKARSHLEGLVALGIRHVGSDANEIHARDLIVQRVEDIIASGSDRVKIEISVQHPSGGYYVDFLGGITHIYQNVTNVVVRLSRKGSTPSDAFMVNAHYDSALGSYAASDDAVSCGIMLEALRSLASEPDPLLADNALIFLFNGAEETLLQASHGFITQHPWAGTIRAFLNLEAAGAGGKEIVFQTGPDHPWLTRLYSEVVPHPHASIVAQEVFQSGIIPSDTDFRVFRDFGHIPGIDTAYFVNGYVYHTEYDIPSAIPDGSIQSAGENVIAFLREVANSPHLSNPTDDDLHGKVVFTDILGLMMVVYPEWVAMVVNFATVLLVVVTFAWGINWTKSENSDKPTLSIFFLSSGIMLASWVAAVVVVVAIATVLTALGESMSWFKQPLLIVPLYVVPACLAVGEVHTQLVKRTEGKIPLSVLEKSSFLSLQVFLSVILFLLTCLHICSAVVFFLIVAVHLLFRSLLFDLLLTPELRKSGYLNARSLAYVLCSAVPVGMLWAVQLPMSLGILELFVPLMGRAGAVVPPDVAIGVLTAILVVIFTLYMVNVVIYSTSRQLKRWAGLIMLMTSLVGIIMTGAGFFNPPYSMDDASSPKPKRLFLVHADRTFYASDGSVRTDDSRVYLYPFDYLGLEPIAKVSPLFKEATFSECEGLYCEEISYIPVRDLIDSWWLPAKRLTGLEAAEIQLLSSQPMSESSRNLTFKANFPKRCTAVVGMEEGVVMKAWSLESYVPKANKCPGSHVERGCYFIFHSRGFGDSHFNFWIEVKTESGAAMATASPVMKIAATAHHLDPPHSHTADLSTLMDALPSWVTPVAWTAMFKEWIF